MSKYIPILKPNPTYRIWKNETIVGHLILYCYSVMLNIFAKQNMHSIGFLNSMGNSK